MYHPDGAALGAPLGPDSILWRYAGDTRIAFLGGTIGVLQLMHPAIGAGVLEHSNFFEDPFDRVFRSLPAILGAVYDADADATGRWIRDQHRTIKGVDTDGRSYHALDPHTYWWAHATFQFMAEQVVDRFDRHRLTERQREQLYQEGITWYRRYGVSDRAVPATRADFQVEWDRVCAEVLEMNDAVRYVLRMLDAPPRLDQPLRLELPAVLRRLEPVVRFGPVTRALAGPARTVTVGGLPPIVRERFGIPFSRFEEHQLRALEVAVRRSWRAVPFSVRWQPRAQEGWRRVRSHGEDKRWRAAV